MPDGPGGERRGSRTPEPPPRLGPSRPQSCTSCMDPCLVRICAQWWRMVGRVVVLNGVSSAGKSTIIDAFCARRGAAGELWMRTGIDDFIAQLGVAFCAIPGHPAPFADLGFQVVELADGSVRCEAGSVGRAVFRTYQRTVAAWAHDGRDVIVDECAFDREQGDGWADALDGIATLWVAVHCAPDVVAQRERDRGDRIEGLAASQLAHVHANRTYDLELDTTTTPTDESVAALEHAITSFAW